MNFKGIDFKTEWLEYPDLAPTLKSLGVPPNDSKDPEYYTDYTSPAIQYDDGSFGMDSIQIARELEKRYPSPPLHLDNPIVANFSLAKFQGPLVPHVVSKVLGRLLSERSADYFRRTREDKFGMPLAQVDERATEERWEEAKDGVKELVDLLKKNGGPYILGETGKHYKTILNDECFGRNADELIVSYADFILVSFIAFLKRVDEEVFKRFIALDDSLEKVYKATEKWL